MTDHYCPTAADLGRFRVGPIAPQLPSFAALISRLGYRDAYGWRKVLLVSDFSRWLQRNSIALFEVNEEQVEAFLRARRRTISLWSGTTTTMAQLLQHLRQANLIAALTPSVPRPTAIELVERNYGQFLLQERCLAQGTAALYMAEARRFLCGRFQSGRVNLTVLRARDVTNFILHDRVNRRRRSAQLMASALRSFLRFLFQKRLVPANLTGAVPRVAIRRLSELPRYLEPGQVRLLLQSCDRRRKIGKRDYALMLLSARLGLRAGELIGLTLHDINWAAGELLVRGKRARADRLPLLKDVGAALADYLQKGRPKCSSERIFLRGTAPYSELAHHASVYRIVQSALQRSGLRPPHGGAHLLRHSLATCMLRQGASLAQIGQVLRHQLPQATEIYAKVDLNALRTLALPWPGGAL